MSWQPVCGPVTAGSGSSTLWPRVQDKWWLQLRGQWWKVQLLWGHVRFRQRAVALVCFHTAAHLQRFNRANEVGSLQRRMLIDLFFSHIVILVVFAGLRCMKEACAFVLCSGFTPVHIKHWVKTLPSSADTAQICTYLFKVYRTLWLYDNLSHNIEFISLSFRSKTDRNHSTSEISLKKMKKKKKYRHPFRLKPMHKLNVRLKVGLSIW